MTTPIRARRSIGTMVAASLLSAVCGIVQTFWIPRLLSVDSYGYWRMFLLYIGYAGLLHLGFVDGALLVWSKNPHHRGPDRILLGHSLRFILIEQLALIGASFLILLRPSAHAGVGILVAFGLYTLSFNVLGLTQVYLQSHARFGPVALGNSLPGATFVVLLAGLALTHHATVNGLLAAYLTAWGITVTVLLIQALRPTTPTLVADFPTANQPPAHISASRLGFAYIAAGWPIVLANTGFGLMQSADRVTVNLTRPIHDFAIYSLSQSTIYVPITILAAIARVAFTYFARTSHEGRAGLYRSSTRSLTLLWMLLLPYYFVVEFVVNRFLPKYVPGLPAGRILLLSVLFLSLIQIVQLNTYNLEGRQRHFLAGALVAVAVAFTTAWIGSRVIGTLAAVAWSQVLTAALWWLGNEYFLRKRTGVRWQDILRVLLGFAASAALLEGIETRNQNFFVASTLYATAILAVACPLFYEEFQKALRWTQRSRRTQA